VRVRCTWGFTLNSQIMITLVMRPTTVVKWLHPMILINVDGADSLLLLIAIVMRTAMMMTMMEHDDDNKMLVMVAVVMMMMAVLLSILDLQA